MKSLQICLLSALLVICASNPIPEETVSPTGTPVAPEIAPEAKSPESSVPSLPAGQPGIVPDAVPAEAQKTLENEKIPEPQALPSKKEDAPAAKVEEKREAPPAAAANNEQSAVKTEELAAKQEPAQPEPDTGKSLPDPVKTVAAGADAAKIDAKLVESAKSAAVEAAQKPDAPAPTPEVIPEVKAADGKAAVESTVVPIVPAAIGSEKKIDAEAPAAIVSENVKEAVQQEQDPKLALPVPAGQVQDKPQEPEVPKVQERSASEPTAVPAQAADASSSGSSEKKVEEQDSSSSSSEESKESQEEEKKTA